MPQKKESSKPTLSEVNQNLEIDEKYLLSLLKEFVRIDSTIGLEKELANIIKEELRDLGLKVTSEKVEEKRENVYGSYSFSNSGKTLTFNGHLDTVTVCKGWETDPFNPTIRNNMLYGLGSLDMKSGLACQLAAIKALMNLKIPLKGTLHFAAVVDEEGNGKGAKKMLQNPIFGKGKTDGIIIAEPFFGESHTNPLPLGMTGKLLYQITFQGKSAHAFQPEEGINAINEAAIFLEAIGRASKKEKGLRGQVNLLQSDENFGKESFCVLKITGGYEKYSVMVPEKCTIILNHLTVPGTTHQDAIDKIRNFISKLNLQSSVEIQVIPPTYTPYIIAKDELLVQSLFQSYQEVRKMEPKTNYLHMITDGNTFAGEGGIPTVLVGPLGKNIHGANEYVELSSLPDIAAIHALTYYKLQRLK
jgi:succinyl-diaminopimelate desuccinylase